MNEQLLKACGFNTLGMRAGEQEVVEYRPMNVSVVRAVDHANPQLVFKLSREVLNKMKWEITDRVKVLSNHHNKSIALIKANKDEADSFAISTQGTSIENAISTGRGGVVKVGWRSELCEQITGHGTYASQVACAGPAMIVQLPQDIFA